MVLREVLDNAPDLAAIRVHGWIPLKYSPFPGMERTFLVRFGVPEVAALKNVGKPVAQWRRKAGVPTLAVAL
jgi:hypothetical protein